MQAQSTPRLARLLAAGLLATAVAAGTAGAQVMAPTDPILARWIGAPDTGSSFVLGATTNRVQLARFDSPRRMRICVRTATTPASLSVGARVLVDGQAYLIGVAHCQDVTGANVVATPAKTLGAGRRVHGTYAVLG